MESVKEWIGFLANIVGALGIVFFFYDYSKDRNEERKAIKYKKEKEKQDFLLTRKFIFQNAISRINLSKSEDTEDKMAQLLYEDNYQEDDYKFVAVEDSLLDIKMHVRESIETKEITHLYVMPEGITSELSNELVSNYVERIDSIEKVIKKMCEYLFEESLKYTSMNNNSDIVELLDEIYSIKSEVEKRSIEVNDLALNEDSKIEFLLNKTGELKEQFNKALVEGVADNNKISTEKSSVS